MESSDAAPFHPQAQIITSSKDIDSSIKHNPRIPDKISPDSLQGKKSGPDRLKLKFLDDQTHHVAIRILTDDEQKNLDKYGAAGGRWGFLTLEHWRWKPLTIKDEKENSVRILVNVSSAKNRLKQFADLKQIKESFQKGTFLDDISQRVLKHKLLNTKRASFVNLESKDYKRIAAKISFPTISDWFATGEIKEEDVDDFIGKLQQKIESGRFKTIDSFKEEFILHKKIESKLAPHLKNLESADFLYPCVRYLRQKILEDKQLKEIDIDVFIEKHKTEIENVEQSRAFVKIVDAFIHEKPLEPIRSKLQGDIKDYVKWLDSHVFYEPANAKQLDYFMNRLAEEHSDEKQINIESFNQLSNEISAEREFRLTLMEPIYQQAINGGNEDCIKTLAKLEVNDKFKRDDIKKFLGWSSSIDSFYNDGKQLEKAFLFWMKLGPILKNLSDKDVQKTEELKAQISLKMSSGEIKIKKNLSELLKSALFTVFKNEVQLTRGLLKNIWAIYNTRSSEPIRKFVKDL